MRPVNSRTLNLIESFEGCVLHPYQDSVGVWTIGFGHTEGVGPHSPSLKNRAAASQLLRSDLVHKYAPYIDRLGLNLNDNQRGALISLVYNIGPGYLSPGHTMGDALRAHNFKAAANAFLLYDRAGGQVLQGLKRRRQAERKLFLTKSQIGPNFSLIQRLLTELTKRRSQLHNSHIPGQRHFLIRRINQIKSQIQKLRKRP